MHYTLDSLKHITDSPIDQNKWGTDTHRVISILNIIFAAGCSSCMFRRKLSELRKIFDKYGDTIDGSTYHVEVPAEAVRVEDPHKKTVRIACTDCVAKHLSQAYVLQNEFYQGYTDYVALIESHLNEAIEECPKSNKPLLMVLNRCLKSVIVDGKPSIPIVLSTRLSGSADMVSNTDDVKCSLIPASEMTGLMSSLPDPEFRLVLDMVSNVPAYTRSSGIDVKFDWYGRLATIADTLSRYSVLVAAEVRRRRLKYYNNPVIEDIDIMKCSDIKAAAFDEATKRGIK